MRSGPGSEGEQGGALLEGHGLEREVVAVLPLPAGDDVAFLVAPIVVEHHVRPWGQPVDEVGDGGVARVRRESAGWPVHEEQPDVVELIPRGAGVPVDLEVTDHHRLERGEPHLRDVGHPVAPQELAALLGVRLEVLQRDHLAVDPLATHREREAEGREPTPALDHEGRPVSVDQVDQEQQEVGEAGQPRDAGRACSMSIIA